VRDGSVLEPFTNVCGNVGEADREMRRGAKRVARSGGETDGGDVWTWKLVPEVSANVPAARATGSGERSTVS
jgi:pyridoxal biosynthesis lyase PdxS